LHLRFLAIVAVQEIVALQVVRRHRQLSELAPAKIYG
jgi:hypothetical protein